MQYIAGAGTNVCAASAPALLHQNGMCTGQGWDKKIPKNGKHVKIEISD
jgi:hypothetical protein